MLDVYETHQIEDLPVGQTVPRRAVERIDCCHSEIHRHVFTVNSKPTDQLGERVPLRKLTADDAKIVDREYDYHHDLLMNDWRERVRRWMNG